MATIDATGATGASGKRRITRLQAAALALLVVGVGTTWAVPALSGSGKAATCTAHDELPPEYVSGLKLCQALSTPEVAVLVGAPGEHVERGAGDGSYVTMASGTKTAEASAQVQLETYVMKIEADYDTKPASQMAGQQTTIAGHPAVLSSDHVVTFTPGGKATTGGVSRVLLVAMDARDSGGTFELVIWRRDGATPDDAGLLRVAEQVLPTLQGWKN